MRSLAGDPVTKVEEAQNRRRKAADWRMRLTGRVRGVGSWSATVGVVVFVVVIIIVSLEPVPEAMRAVGLVSAAMLWLGGGGLWIGGWVLQLVLAQLADDRAEAEEARELEAARMAQLAAAQKALADQLATAQRELGAVLLELVEIRKRQVFLLSSLGAEAAAVVEVSERFQDLEADVASVRLWQQRVDEETQGKVNGKVTALRPASPQPPS